MFSDEGKNEWKSFSFQTFNVFYNNVANLYRMKITSDFPQVNAASWNWIPSFPNTLTHRWQAIYSICGLDRTVSLEMATTEDVGQRSRCGYFEEMTRRVRFLVDIIELEAPSFVKFDIIWDCYWCYNVSLKMSIKVSFTSDVCWSCCVTVVLWWNFYR